MPKELRLLLLEDEAADAELTEHALRRAGLVFLSRRVDSRDAFVAALDEFRPDLVLADYRLPAFDGLEALTIAVERAPEVPFIFVSGAMGEELAIDTLRQGAADYVLKGHLNKLVPAVNRALLDVEERRRRKQAEADILRSNAELEQYSYSISHDMRQPLRMISSYLQLLEKSLADRLDGEQREYLHFAIDGAQRLDAMLLGLLEYSRIGRLGEPPARVASRAVLDDVLRFLEPATAEAQADVRVEGVWPEIVASPDEMLRLLQNLIGNALKFRVAGRTPRITITSGIDGRQWRVSVADNGIGVLPDQAGRLFQVFQRLQSRVDYEGTGIGLALCRKIAEHHGGRIWVESSGKNQGAAFIFTLPVVNEDT
ncbi:MAG: ATP-binding protein [Proteobacteria bacterium]|nr:ATP-binding protein [Pseudomonadota bacterium]